MCFSTCFANSRLSNYIDKSQQSTAVCECVWNAQLPAVDATINYIVLILHTDSHTFPVFQFDNFTIQNGLHERFSLSLPAYGLYACKNIEKFCQRSLSASD